MPTAAPPDIQQALDARRLAPFQWTVFGLCFLVVLCDGFDTAAIGFIAPSLLQQWALARPALGPVLSAALFGLAGGALLAGPLADRLGRKAVLVASVALFGAASLGAAFAADLGQLTVLRFVTGLGLGAAMPNAVTLTSEYCPARHRALLTNAMFCGFPLGAALGGFLAASMIPRWGWRSVLALGGAAPLLLAVVMLVLLPESLRYLLARGLPAARVDAVWRRLAPDLAGRPGGPAAADPGVPPRRTPARSADALPAAAARTGLALVLSAPYRLGSAMLWTAYFMGLVIFYALINWMPLLFKDAGLGAREAALVAALFPLGGVGAIASGWLMDRYDATLVIAAGFALTALAVAAIGQATGHVGWLVLAVLLAGTLMNTAQSSLPALAAGFYATGGRATGVAWMLGLGRFGGIAGSLLVAELARRQLGVEAIFAVLALPAVLAAVALGVKHRAAARP